MDAMTTTSKDPTEMSDTELAKTATETQAEIERRARVRGAELATDDMALSYLQAAGREQGQPFESPLGFIGAYPRGWRVTHNGEAFEATAPGVTTAPPSDCWTEVPADSPMIPFWDPGTYDKDARVRDAGQVWRTLADGTDGPRPSEFPGGWSVVD